MGKKGFYKLMSLNCLEVKYFSGIQDNCWKKSRGYS